MAIISVLYDFHEDGIKPFTMVIKFKTGEMDWNKNFLNIPVTAPFKRFMSSDFSDDVMSSVVLLEDLTVHPDKPNTFGLHIPTIKARYEASVNLIDIEQLIVRMGDIEDVMQMDIREYFNWR